MSQEAGRQQRLAGLAWRTSAAVVDEPRLTGRGALARRSCRTRGPSAPHRSRQARLKCEASSHPLLRLKGAGPRLKVAEALFHEKQLAAKNLSGVRTRIQSVGCAGAPRQGLAHELKASGLGSAGGCRPHVTLPPPPPRRERECTVNIRQGGRTRAFQTRRSRRFPITPNLLPAPLPKRCKC